MADREKVIKALDCRANDSDMDCRKCDYYNSENTPAYCRFRNLLNDAIELLKEQEPVVRCRDCKYWTVGDFGPFCPYHHDARPDWFCADGECET